MSVNNSRLGPFETSKNGRFLTFEMDNHVIGFPYAGIRKYDWTSSKSSELLEFHFDDSTAVLAGTGLRRLLPMLQSEELFIIRVGRHEDSNNQEPLHIFRISYEIKNDDIVR